jgi:hypothetical protein
MRGLAFRFLMLLCVLASTAQGFVAQTHVHPGVARLAAVASVPAAADTPVVDAAPRPEATCVLCEIAGHSPAAAPPASAAIIPVAALPRLSPPESRRAVLAAAPSHHWSGRGPPSV